MYMRKICILYRELNNVDPINIRKKLKGENVSSLKFEK